MTKKRVLAHILRKQVDNRTEWKRKQTQIGYNWLRRLFVNLRNAQACAYTLKINVKFVDKLLPSIMNIYIG